MIFGSVCSGIEAASVAWGPLGWRAAWLSEIDKFPSRVLAHRYPEVPNLGDMTKLHANKTFLESRIDLLVGGTPCQSFSVAGLRKGLDDPRGNLCLEFLRLVDCKQPKWFVWENVPGVLSSSGGRDFGSFLGAIQKLGYGFAYRILDAQYFGVPQRRRRVFVIGYFGDYRPAAAVLFESESLCGNSTKSREKRQDIAPTISARTKGGGGLGTDFDLDGGLVESFNLRGISDYSERGRAQLRASSGGGDKVYTPVKSRVRRLTPKECERLQGFPDDYTLLGDKTADGPRYKALGNSMAVPVMRWIGERIQKVNQVKKEGLGF